MPLALQDFKLKGEEVGEIVNELPAPDDSQLESTVRRRMQSHFEARNGITGVRVIDDSGTERYRWTWWDEQSRRQQVVKPNEGQPDA
jgi:hypothetical protein